MPLRAKGGVRYRYRPGTHIRLAFTRGGKVIEAKNMKTGATHTPAEFRRDARRHSRRGRRH